MVDALPRWQSHDGTGSFKHLVLSNSSDFW
jgi:hypothetical protein